MFKKGGFFLQFIRCTLDPKTNHETTTFFFILIFQNKDTTFVTKHRKSMHATEVFEALVDIPEESRDQYLSEKQHPDIMRTR